MKRDGFRGRGQYPLQIRPSDMNGSPVAGLTRVEKDGLLLEPMVDFDVLNET